MTFYIQIHSGLNNKLIPLLSLLRIARKENRKIKCFWGPDAYTSSVIFKFLDLFEPIKDIDIINQTEYIQAFNNNNYTQQSQSFLKAIKKVPSGKLVRLMVRRQGARLFIVVKKP